MMSIYKISSRVATRKFARYLSAIAVKPIQDFKFETTVELQIKAAEAYSTNPMLGTRVGNAYEWINYTDFDKEVRKFRAVLTSHKVSMDDKVAIISNNRVEWAVVKYATNGVGAQIVPM